MSKYGELVIFNCSYKMWAIVAKYTNYQFTLAAGGMNFYGVTVRLVRTPEKAIRIDREYNRRMKRT